MGLENRVDIQVGDFRVLKPKISDVDILLLNPARNGVGKFLSQLLPLKPTHILYMSCFPKSFFEDIQILADYSLKNVQLIDQFPNTSHIEILAEFIRK
jgi:tRNA/tmRNA/rRNA uracil-C5-methylase (TrmA/RlmC/RlmD family)